jgi:hypothetical protein
VASYVRGLVLGMEVVLQKKKAATVRSG